MGEVEIEDVPDDDASGEMRRELPHEVAERRSRSEHRSRDPVQPARSELARAGHGYEARPLAEWVSVGVELDDRTLEHTRHRGVESGRLDVDDRESDRVRLGERREPSRPFVTPVGGGRRARREDHGSSVGGRSSGPGPHGTGAAADRRRRTRSLRPGAGEVRVVE